MFHIDENHPLCGQSPYAATKIGADQMAMSFFRSFGTPVTIVRPFNTYGPRQSARAVIPTIISQIASGAVALRLGSLEPTRDFNYIEDTINGFMAVAESQNTVGQVVNIGSGFEVSIGKTADIIRELMHSEIPVIAEDQRIRPPLSEVDRLLASNAKAKALAGWEPAYAGEEGFRRGLEKTIAWFNDPTNLRGIKWERYNV